MDAAETIEKVGGGVLDALRTSGLFLGTIRKKQQFSVARNTGIKVKSSMRVALLVGVNEYAQDPLSNCVSDAQKIEVAIKSRGFQCRVLENATSYEIDAVLESFAADAASATTAFVYLAGHGVEHHGAGYFLGVDFPFPVSASKLAQYAIAIPRVVESMPNDETAKIIVADMCRNWPASAQSELLQQLDDLRKAEIGFENVVVGYSTSAGDTASDGAGANSRYCDAFCEALLDHGLTFENVFHKVADQVISTSGRLQRPWHYSSMRKAGSFSDIKSLTLLNAVSTPLKTTGEPLFVSKLRHQEGIFASGNLSSAWRVTMSGTERVGPHFETSVLGIGHLDRNRCAVLLEDGQLVVFDEDRGHTIYVDQSLDRPSLIITSAVSNIVVVCAGEKANIYVFGETDITIYVTSMTSAIHCGLILSDNEVWLAGGLGTLLRASVQSNDTLSTNERNYDRNNINFLVRSSVPNEVIAVGTGGEIQFLSTVNLSVLRSFHLGDRVSTPRAIRGSLVDAADADNVSMFIKQPLATAAEVREFLLHQIPARQLLWCDVSPTQPLLAVASEEGVVFMIDLRDGRPVQTIDLWMGAGNTPHGMAFLNDGTLAILLGDGLVVFYGELGPVGTHASLTAGWVTATSEVLSLAEDLLS